MFPKYPVMTSLMFGLISYCLVLLVSQDASILSLEIMGTLSLTLIALSMFILWRQNETEDLEDSIITGSESAPRDTGNIAENDPETR